MAIAFNQDDVPYLVQKGLTKEGFIDAELSAEQFKIFEHYCSGSSLAGDFTAATLWAQQHWTQLDAEAREWLEDDTDHPAAGRYHLPMGHCAFCAVEDFVFYETTSKTLLVVAKDGSNYVRIPAARKDGFHHAVVKNLLDGWTAEQIDRRINSHRYAHLFTEED